MKKDNYKIVGIGEVLFDILPTGQKMLGGAPANFAYVCGRLGSTGIVASRVGADNAGEEILLQLADKNIETGSIQRDREHKTGTVRVTLRDGQPEYKIFKNAAWDFLQFTDGWKNLAKKCDAVCFGTLAQRNSVSRKTIHAFLETLRPNCVRVFDINLRQNFYTEKIIKDSLAAADILKLNDEELPKIIEIFGIKGSNVENYLQYLLEQFDLQLVCLTRGTDGSFLFGKNDSLKHQGLKIRVADTIGAGDAFTAALTHGMLQGWELAEVNEKANRVAAFVASKNGAMPEFDDFRLNEPGT